MSKNLETAIAAIQAEADVKIAKLRTEYAVLELLPDPGAYAPPMIVVHPLYGADLHVNYRIQHYASIAGGKDPDTDLLEALMAQFPPLDMVMVKDGCKSFRLAGPTYPGEITPVHPVQVRIEMQFDTSAQVMWLAQLPNGLKARFEVSMPLQGCPKLGVPFIRRESGGDRLGRVIECEFKPPFAKHGEPQTHVIKWGAGDRYTLNSFTCWWEKDNPPTQPIPDFWR